MNTNKKFDYIKLNIMKKYIVEYEYKYKSNQNLKLAIHNTNYKTKLYYSNNNILHLRALFEFF